jgi:glycosyltransferase involved in cell wall biosynthesis
MTTSKPRVTVGVPVYNGEHYLAATLDSLLDQTVDDFVILVGDNASTDGTADIVQAYARRDSRVRHVRHPRNLGAAGNYSRLCRMADTEFFRWSAADDCSGPRFLQLCLETLEQNPDAVLVYPRVILIDADGHSLGDYAENLHLPQPRAADRFFTLLNNVRLCNALYGVARTDALRRTRLLGSYLGSDIVFQAELALYGKILEAPEGLLFRRMHGATFTSMTVEQQIEFNSPGRRQRSEFYWWRHLREHTHSILRAPLPVSERLAILKRLLRRAISGRDALLREILTAGRSLRLGRSS